MSRLKRTWNRYYPWMLVFVVLFVIAAGFLISEMNERPELPTEQIDETFALAPKETRALQPDDIATNAEWVGQGTAPCTMFRITVAEWRTLSEDELEGIGLFYSLTQQAIFLELQDYMRLMRMFIPQRFWTGECDLRSGTTDTKIEKTETRNDS